MKLGITILLALPLLFGAVSAMPAEAQAGAAAREIVEALGRHGARKAATTTGRVLVGEGAEAAAARLGPRLLREGGEELLERVSRHAEVLGAPFVRALDSSPAPRKLLEAIDALPVASQGRAVSALAREGRVLGEAVEQVGREAFEAELRHPGLGGSFVAKLGDDGVEVALRNGTDDLAVLARHQDEVVALAPEARASVVGAFKNNGAAAARWLRSNPGYVLTGATAAVLVANSERVADGVMDVVETGAGTLGRIGETASAKILGWFLPVLSLALAGWLGLRLWPRWRRVRAGR